MRRLLIFVLPALALALAGCAVGAPSQPATPSHVALADGASAALSPSASPPPASLALRPGMRVGGRLLQGGSRRNYRAGWTASSANTLEAVWAFRRRKACHCAVNSAMQRALASRGAQVLVPHGGRPRSRSASKIRFSSSTGTIMSLVSRIHRGGRYFCSPNGCGDPITPTGDFTTLSFIPGRVTVPLGGAQPVFFIGTLYAIHGDMTCRSVASHGCVRIRWASPRSSTRWYRPRARRCTSAVSMDDRGVVCVPRRDGSAVRDGEVRRRCGEGVTPDAFPRRASSSAQFHRRESLAESA